MAKVDVAKLEELVAQGYLIRRDHPDFLDLHLWNYTQKTQFEKKWTPETRMCRGLITRTDGTIVSRCMPKFFNVEEIDNASLPVEPFEVTMKMDGSMGQLYWIHGAPYIATRGSFESDQAKHATRVYRERYWKSDNAHQAHPEYSYVFEVIYPENRIVVDYGRMDDLVLIAVIHTETGAEVPLRLIHDQPFPVAKVYDGVKDFAELRAEAVENEEGYVVRFEQSGLRVKMKHAEYVRLHRILTNVTERTIWECLSTGTGLDAMLDRVPDEFYGWVQMVVARNLKEFSLIEQTARTRLAKALVDGQTRKERAEIIKSGLYPSVTFAMLDEKDYASIIWKMLRPAANAPFKVTE